MRPLQSSESTRLDLCAMDTFEGRAECRPNKLRNQPAGDRGYRNSQSECPCETRNWKGPRCRRKVHRRSDQPKKYIIYISSLHSADESQEGRNSCPLLRSCFIGSCRVWCLKTSCSLLLVLTN